MACRARCVPPAGDGTAEEMARPGPQRPGRAVVRWSCPECDLVLHAVAANVRQLPYDIQIEVEDTRHIGKAVTLSQYLARQEYIHPGRLGVGVRDSDDPWKDSAWLVYARHQ